MASDDVADRDAAFARLSGPDIVARLRTTFWRADYDAAARELAARDRRLAQAEAAVAELRSGLEGALAQVEAMREKYLALKKANGGPTTTRRPSPSDDAIAAPAPQADRRAEEEWEDGEFRPDAAGVSCKRKESASEGGEGRRAGFSCKRKAPAAACSSDDDEDVKIPLSQLMKKRLCGEPGANGRPKKRHGDVQGNSAWPLGVDRNQDEAISEHRGGGCEGPKLAVLLQGKGNGRSGEDGGLPRTKSSPLASGSAAGNSSQKNSSKTDGAQGGARIGEKQDHVAVPDYDVPFQAGNPHLSGAVRRIVESLRVAVEMPKEHTGSSPDGSISMPLKGTKQQEKPNGQVLKTMVLPGADGIVEEGGKLSPCQSQVFSDRGRLRNSDKPVSAVLKPNNELPLHSEQMSVESSLPSAVTRHWNSASDVFTSCLQNGVLCMQAACALHRQGKFTAQQAGGRSGCPGLTKLDAHRASVLAGFLLDGNLQGPLKKSFQELEMHDPTGPNLLERVALQCSEQLFSIYRNKEDKYFR